jgi:hypothetical protein
MIAYQKIILFLEPIHQHSFMLEYDYEDNIPHGFSCPTQQLLGVAFTCPVNESAGWRQRFVEKPRYRCSGSGQGHIDAMSCHKNQQVIRALGANWRICSCVSASQNPNFCYVGMKAHIGADTASGLVHSLHTTPANISDVAHAHKLLHGQEAHAHTDAGYVGVEKCPEIKQAQQQKEIHHDIQ